MLTLALLENNKLVLRAFATLVDAAPSHADYESHLQFIQSHGKEHYINTLNQAFASYSDEQLAGLLLKSTGLNGIDLEGDGNIDNMTLATSFIRANSGNRIRAMLDLTEQLSNIQSGALRDIATAYRHKISEAHEYSRFLWWGTERVHFNDNHQVQGGPGDDVFYADGNTGGKAYLINGQEVHSKAVWIFNTDENNSVHSAKLHDPKPGLPTTVGSYGVKVQVSYHGIKSQAIAIADQADYQANQQDINQAIKQAINSDAVLNKLFQAEDGLNGTLLVLAKANLYDSPKISFIAPGINELSPQVVQNFISHNPRSGVTDAASMLRHIEKNVTSDDHSSIYNKFYKKTVFGYDDLWQQVKGARSNTPKDHIIEGGAGNDIIVLGTASNEGIGKNKVLILGTASNPFYSPENSNNTVKYSGAFGHDFIINFVAKATSLEDDFLISRNKDKFDFAQLHRTSPDVITTVNHTKKYHPGPRNKLNYVTDGEILINYNAAQSAEEVKNIFTDPGAGSAAKQLYISVDKFNTGQVYQVTDGAGANDITVNMLGTITLDYNAPWSILTAEDFV